jgi:hypothetical protein|tara:strand:+ start:669 stop:842 length:174 start_codon:yes stop_codon:yes gene_type:complete
MIRILFFGTLAYLVYTLFKKVKIISKSNQNVVNKREPYKNLDIKDADFEDMNKKENE